eukprot:Clim_evm112s210 gene=Clim_evmTU112s210
MGQLCSCIPGLGEPGSQEIPLGSYRGSHADVPKESPIKLNQQAMGIDAIVVKNGKRLCGSGGCLANAPLVQDKSYFEVKLQANGVWGVGVATNKATLGKIQSFGTEPTSWVIMHDGKVMHQGVTEHDLGEDWVAEGDVIGIAYDHDSLRFFKNGVDLDVSIHRFKGTMFPLLYVDDGAILDAQFRDFDFDPPSGFQEILLEQSIL